MKHLLITLILIFLIFCGASAQTKTPSVKVMTKQDSINVFVQQRDSYVDSLLTKTSLKEFQKWLDESVSSKMLREGKLNELWTAFIDTKINEWVVKNKIAVPRN
jgi:uncharacterized protein YxeA